MWIFTKNGYYSVVQNTQNPNEYLVRSRARTHMQHLVSELGLTEFEDCKTCDYRYRVRLQKEEFTKFLLENLADIDYPNFKNAVAEEPDSYDYLDALHRIWSITRSSLKS